jgi:predicted O-methyltransferase YrrM
MLPENYENIHGWCTREKATKLMKIITDMKPSLCVELGVFGGKSLLAIGLAAKNARVIGIDAWSKPASLEGTNDPANADWWAQIDYDYFYKYTADLMKKNGLSVELWRNKSNEVSKKFNDESIDFLHQDSNHSEEITCEEVELYWNKVREKGIWVFDDINWPTTKKAQSLLIEKGYEEIYAPEGREWAVYQRKSFSVTSKKAIS